MANTYDLTQTGSEVQAILNDANNIKGAGAQTTLTTDYILLKDTNGQYHKILKDSFTEACRNVLAGLLVNNDKGTTISQIAAVASGDFGSVTPANLASVLGVGGIHRGDGVDNKFRATDIHIQGTDVLKIGIITSTYRSILLMGSDLGGLILLSITREGNTSDATGIKVYGKSNGLKLYVDSNYTIYMQSMSGHLTQPIAYHSGSNQSDMLYMNKMESLPSGVVELTVTNTFA